MAFSLIHSQPTSHVEGQINNPTKKRQPEQKPTPTQQQTENRTPTQPQEPEGLSGVFAAARQVQVEALNERGPQFQPSLDTGKFMILAFVKGDWPVQIEYQLEERSAAIVTVLAIASRKSKTFELPGTGKRRMEKLKLPADFGELEPGLITIESFSDLRDRKDHVGFQLYGIGLGVEDRSFKPNAFHPSVSQPAAVMLAGQITPVSFSFQASGIFTSRNLFQSGVISNLTFTPGSINANQGDKVTYTFTPLNNFGTWAADFRLVTKEPNAEGRIIPKTKWVRTDQFDEEISPSNPVSREWNGKDSKGRISRGEHRLIVRTWWSALKGGSSATRIADDPITVQ